MHSAGPWRRPGQARGVRCGRPSRRWRSLQPERPLLLATRGGGAQTTAARARPGGCWQLCRRGRCCLRARAAEGTWRKARRALRRAWRARLPRPHLSRGSGLRRGDIAAHVRQAPARASCAARARRAAGPTLAAAAHQRPARGPAAHRCSCLLMASQSRPSDVLRAVALSLFLPRSVAYSRASPCRALSQGLCGARLVAPGDFVVEHAPAHNLIRKRSLALSPSASSRAGCKVPSRALCRALRLATSWRGGAGARHALRRVERVKWRASRAEAARQRL